MTPVARIRESTGCEYTKQSRQSLVAFLSYSGLQYNSSPESDSSFFYVKDVAWSLPNVHVVNRSSVQSTANRELGGCVPLPGIHASGGRYLT